MATTGQTYTVNAYPVADSTVVRRNGVLFGSYPNQRLEPRGLAVLPIAVRADGQECVGLLRDISQTGMFFYCSLRDRKSTRLNSSHMSISYAVFCLKKKKKKKQNKRNKAAKQREI